MAPRHPVAAAGVLAAHALAYGLTGTTAGSVHAYLAHAPQVVAVLASIGLVGLAVQERSFGRLPLWPFALVGPLGFICPGARRASRPHGRAAVPPDDAAFPVGLVLQLPVALLCVSSPGALPGHCWRQRCADQRPWERRGCLCRHAVVPAAAADRPRATVGRRRRSSRPEPTRRAVLRGSDEE